jgi:general secretion pathway protein F/type IV pilus assembly protein PilC
MATGGQRSQGTLVANSEREVMAMLDARGLFPVSVRPAKASGGGGSSLLNFHIGRRVKSRQLATFFSQLADLLHAGVPLLRSLDILERQSANAYLSGVLREVRARVADGTALSAALGQHPQAFDELTVSMVRAGQEGGFLEDVLKRIADFTEHQEDLKSKVTGALIYPVFLGVVGFLILNGLIIFVVPLFKPIFEKLEKTGDLPWLTQALIATSQFMQVYGIFILIAGIAAFLGFRAWARSERGHYALDSIRLRAPLGAGAIFLQLALSRFTRVLGTLLKNGIPILQALRIAKDSAGNKVIAEAIEKSAENIKSGDSLAGPLAASKHFPRDVVEMVAVGEESNNLEKVLLDISVTLEKRTNRQLDMFVKLLEPVMLLGMAAVTLLIVMGLLLPVFKMSTAVG